MDTLRLREALLTRRMQIAARHAKISSRLRRDGAGLSNDWPEQAQERENDEVLEGLDEAGRAEMLAIDATLQRLEDDSFGLCAECGAAIPERRLAVMPTATHCVSCA